VQKCGDIKSSQALFVMEVTAGSFISPRINGNSPHNPQIRFCNANLTTFNKTLRKRLEEKL